MAEHVTSPPPRGIRRYLRFSLRSLMLATLAVAAWLGYEVHQARTVQRQTEAIRALGGEAEFETSPWSLLRFVEPQTYGRRIASAEIPATRAVEALPWFEKLPALREIRVAFDGTENGQPTWRVLRAQPRNWRVIPVSGRVDLRSDCRAWVNSASQRRFQRFRAAARDDRLAGQLQYWFDRYTGNIPWSSTDTVHYHVVALPDGALGELLIVHGASDMGTEGGALLLVNDTCVDTRRFAGGEIDGYARDLAGDGVVEFVVEYLGSTKRNHPWFQSLPNDPRTYRGLYALETTGFRNLLPEDRLKKD